MAYSYDSQLSLVGKVKHVMKLPPAFDRSGLHVYTSLPSTYWESTVSGAMQYLVSVDLMIHLAESSTT